jgi:hypothetical protein
LLYILKGKYTMTVSGISEVSRIGGTDRLSSQAGDVESVGTVDSRWKALYRVSGLAALLQLICLFASMIIAFTLGAEPGTAAEYFSVLRDNRLVGLLRMDFPTLIMTALFAITTFSLYAALKRKNEVYVALATALVFTGVILLLATHSAFSMLYLDARYAAATTEAQRAQILAAGDAVIAANIWNSTGGFMAGLFWQGGYVLLSLVMLRNKAFSKVTAYSGLVANGLDWLHVIVNLFVPAAGVFLLSVGGLFYLVWFPSLARDLLRLARPGESR